jgi:hypothetical protein
VQTEFKKTEKNRWPVPHEQADSDHRRPKVPESSSNIHV